MAPMAAQELAEAPEIEIDFVLLHGQRADTSGNVELSSAQGLDRSLALAGRRVLATVEEVVQPGTLGERAAVIPRQFIEAVAVEPGGAWPTSCLPYYGTDFGELARRVEARRFAGSDDARPPAQARLAAAIDWSSAPWPAPNVKRDAASEMIDGLARPSSRRPFGVLGRLGLFPGDGGLPRRQGQPCAWPVTRDA